MVSTYALLFSALLSILPARAASGLSYNGKAITPQMGWDTYNAYAYTYDETTLRTNAQRMVDLGMRDLGYKVIILDDAMTEKYRSPNGTLVANSTKFPSGLASLADSFHSMGLEFGVYSSAGRFTCGGYPGSLGYETQDAEYWAAIGADYLKYDNCFNEGLSGTPKLSQDRYAAMSNALNSTSRNFTYSLCNWGDDKPWEWASTIANSARISGDIFDSFTQPTTACPCDQDQYYCEIPGYTCNVMNILGKASFITSKNQPGYWNDLDMLEVGNGAMTTDEYKTHFSMWAAIKSPLIMGNNLNALSPEDYAMLINPAVLAISQDPSGSAISRRWRKDATSVDQYGYGELQCWQGSLANGDQVVAFINAGNSTTTIESSLVDIFGGLSTSGEAATAWDVYDVWGNQTVMNSTVAAAVLSGNMSVSDAPGYYNATAKPWASALVPGNSTDPLLFGTYTTRVPAMGTLSADVNRHGIGMFRLRAVPTESSTKDEL